MTNVTNVTERRILLASALLIPAIPPFDFISVALTSGMFIIGPGIFAPIGMLAGTAVVAVLRRIQS